MKITKNIERFEWMKLEKSKTKENWRTGIEVEIPVEV